MIESQDSILSDFFDDDEFSENATINGKVISVIFDQPNLVDNSSEVPVYLRQPIITVRDYDLIGVDEGDSITLRDRVYKVKTVEPDGTGVSLCQLLIQNE